jgi:hypothetical protein
MKQLILEIDSCQSCPYCSIVSNKTKCVLLDKKLNYYEVISKFPIPEWCELEELDRTDEIT